MNVLTKFRDKLKKKRDTNRVLGIDLFHVYFQYQVLLVSRNAVEYINNIYPRHRAIIAYGMNLNVWLIAIRFQILFCCSDKWIRDWMGDPSIMIRNQMVRDLVCLFISGICVLLNSIGKCHCSRDKYAHRSLGGSGGICWKFCQIFVRGIRGGIDYIWRNA